MVTAEEGVGQESGEHGDGHVGAQQVLSALAADGRPPSPLTRLAEQRWGKVSPSTSPTTRIAVSKLRHIST